MFQDFSGLISDLIYTKNQKSWKKILKYFLKLCRRKLLNWCKVDLSIFIKEVPNSFTLT